MSSPKRFRFTNQLIKSLTPNTSDARSTDAEYSDTEISGLKCLVSRREGRKKFLLRYLYHGRKRAIAIGHWPEVDVNLARQIAIEHKRSLATGTDPKQERENKRMELTFDELFNQHYPVNRNLLSGRFFLLFCFSGGQNLSGGFLKLSGPISAMR